MSYYTIPNKIQNSNNNNPNSQQQQQRTNPNILPSSNIYNNLLIHNSGQSFSPDSSSRIYANNNINPITNHEILNHNNNNYEDLDNLSLPPPPPPSFHYYHQQPQQQQQKPLKIPLNHQESNIRHISQQQSKTNKFDSRNNFPLPPPPLAISSDIENSATYANLIDTFSGVNIDNVDHKNLNHYHHSNQLVVKSIENQKQQQSKNQPPLYGNIDDYRMVKNPTNNNNSIHGSKSKVQNIYDSIFEPVIDHSSLANNNQHYRDQQQQQQNHHQSPFLNQSNQIFVKNYNSKNSTNNNNNKNISSLKNQSSTNIKNYYHPTRSNQTTTISSSPINNNRPKQILVKGNQEKQVDHLTDLLVKSMENSGEIDFYGMCNKCGEKVVGEGSGCTAMEMVYHTQCFTCHGCNSELRGKSFYSMDNNPHCEQCYMNSLEKCSVCEKPILDRILRATGKPYHPSCFTCVVCEKCLDGIPFTVDASNQVHCIDCFHNNFAPRCSVCNKPIIPEAGKTETVRVVALERSFHVNCYKCEDCDLLLSSEVEGRGCYPLDDHILCRGCNAKRVQAITG
ncbi:lipoma-preferred partner zyxin [Dermatophagoides pteronyssinus]|uniref:lipoma-preferred partner zyxin n=1 Tax=Dermatophagoides pteronyssinus TaxID=6956 RepID=UPI003F66182C